jgi:hypothetical protein
VLRAFLACLLLAVPAAARAEDCVLTAGPKDLIARGHDVVVAAGQTVDTAMALDGNVVVKKGAKVKSAVAVNGNVIIEARSKVTGTAAAFGGKIQLAPDAKIEGSRLELGDGLNVTGENGKQVSLKLSISGESLSDMLLAKMVEKARSCRIEQGTDGGIHLL